MKREPSITSNELALKSVSELLAGFASGADTPVRAVETYLQRQAQHGARMAAYICTDDARARAAAQAATERWQNGTARPLEGVPIAVKDLIDVAGLPTTLGSRTQPNTPVANTATVVQRLQDAGAIVLGKVHTEEFAFGSWGINEGMGTPLNAWSKDLPLAPGGSSSGSASAVANGLAPWAVGTDTGGSVRGPAAWQGLVGYKPTPGRISTHGVAPLSPSLDSVGVLCRSLEDALLFTRTVQGLDEADPSTWTSDLDDVGAQLGLGVQGLRLGVLAEADRQTVSAEVLAAYDRVLLGLAEQGAELYPLALPFTLASLADGAVSPLMAVQAHAVRGALADDPSSLVTAPVRARLLAGKMDAATFITQHLLCGEKLQAVRRAVKPCHAVVLPTMTMLPPPVAQADTRQPATLLTRWLNPLGWPGVAVPCGLSGDGRPHSVQCVAPAHQDAMAFRVAEAVLSQQTPLGLPHALRDVT